MSGLAMALCASRAAPLPTMIVPVPAAAATVPRRRVPAPTKMLPEMLLELFSKTTPSLVVLPPMVRLPAPMSWLAAVNWSWLPPTSKVPPAVLTDKIFVLLFRPLMPVSWKVPPLRLMVRAPAAPRVGMSTRPVPKVESVPALMKMLPVKAFRTLVSVSVPAPALVRPPVAAEVMGALMVRESDKLAVLMTRSPAPVVMPPRPLMLALPPPATMMPPARTTVLPIVTNPAAVFRDVPALNFRELTEIAAVDATAPDVPLVAVIRLTLAAVRVAALATVTTPVSPPTAARKKEGPAALR